MLVLKNKVRLIINFTFKTLIHTYMKHGIPLSSFKNYFTSKTSYFKSLTTWFSYGRQTSLFAALEFKAFPWNETLAYRNSLNLNNFLNKYSHIVS